MEYQPRIRLRREDQLHVDAALRSGLERGEHLRIRNEIRIGHVHLRLRAADG